MEKLQAAVKSVLSPCRYRHSLGVVETAAWLARLSGVSEEKAVTAGLLHDYARDLPGEALLNLAADFGILIGAVERSCPVLLHGQVGAELVRRELDIRDPDVQSAIRWHTTGGPALATLDWIVYVADMIEPTRQFPGVDRLRDAAAHSLGSAVRMGLKLSISHSLDMGWPIHEHTLAAWNELALGG